VAGHAAEVIRHAAFVPLTTAGLEQLARDRPVSLLGAMQSDDHRRRITAVAVLAGLVSC
jgi:hypothetical protein